MILTIDWSALTKNRLYSLLSADMPITRATESDELRYRIARKCYEMVDKVKPKAVVIAKDNKLNGKRNYWRSGYLARYYSQNIELYSSESSMHEGYVKIDNVFYELNEAFKGAKVSKKNLPADLTFCSKGVCDRGLLQEDLDAWAPTYKGTRKSPEWVFETSYEDMEALFDEIALQMTTILPNCRIVDAELAEADDVAGVIVDLYKDDHVLATIDQDWYQLISDRVKVINLGTTDLDYVELEDIPTWLETKIIQGDRGDGISGTWIDGKSGCLGQVKAAKIVAEGAQHTLNVGAYTRNKKLIVLDCKTIPVMVQSNIKKAIKDKVRATTKSTWDDMTIVERERKILTTSASTLTQKHSPSYVEPKALQKMPWED